MEIVLLLSRQEVPLHWQKFFYLVSCRSLICYVLINFTSYEQMNNRPKKEHKKIPPNLKTNSEGNLGYNKITHPNIVFFIWWVCSFKYETKRADDSWIVPQFHRLCVLSVWLFDDSYLQVVNFNQAFLSAFWTIKGIILQNSVLPNFITGFAPTNRTQYPFAFHHN